MGKLQAMADLPLFWLDEGKPFEILLVADRKVGDAIVKFDSSVPPTFNQRLVNSTAP